MRIVKSINTPNTYNVYNGGKLVASFMRSTDEAALAAARRFINVNDKA